MGNAVGLVMTGGGARGAYQVGILKRIGEIRRAQTHGNPFSIIGGSSAGAINGCALAAGSDDFDDGTTAPRPAQLEEQVATGRLVGEAGFELVKVPRVIAPKGFFR